MGSPIPNIPLTGSKPIPTLGNEYGLLHTEGGKMGCKVLCRHTRTQNPAPFYAKKFKPMPGLSGAPAALCGRDPSSPPAPNPAKQSQTKFLIFFNPGAGRGRFVFPQQRRSPVFQLGKLLSHATASINFPAPAAIGESFLGKIS